MKPQLRQYFGPGPRHGHPCIELRFPDEAGPVSIEPLAAALRGSALRLPRIDAELTLPQLVGTVSCQLLARPTGPIWSAGNDDGMGWVCATFPSPPLMAQTLWQVYWAIMRPGGAATADLIALQDRVRAISAYMTVVQMSATALGFDVTNLSGQLRINQIGQGAKSLHFRELGSDRAPATFTLFAQNKAASVALLRRAGLPTTRARLVHTPDEVQQAADAIGFPCVVKPINRGQGDGITTGIADAGMLGAAVGFALEHSHFPLLVENHIEGDDHRIMVVNGEMLWAYRRRAAYVTGTGDRTLLDLIGDLNADRAKVEGAHNYLKQITIDEPLKAHLRDRHGLELGSVPAEGRRIGLAGVANVAKGGALADVTSRVHPDNRELVLRVARLLRAHTIGIDFMTPDISRSWKEISCAIIEVNATPGIVSIGDGCHAMRALMPHLRSGIVPSFVIAGSEAYCAERSADIAGLLEERGIAFAAGQYLRHVPRPDHFSASQLHEEIEELLMDPDAEALVITCRAADLEDFGLPLQRADLLLTDDQLIADRFGGHVARAVSEAHAACTIRPLVLDILDRCHAEAALPRPTVEWLDDAATIRCWRLRAIPAAAFWPRIPGTAGRDDGMIDQADVFAAVTALINDRLRETKPGRAGIRLSAPAREEGWEHPYVDARFVPPADEDPAAIAEAVRQAIRSVNDIVGWPGTCPSP